MTKLEFIKVLLDIDDKVFDFIDLDVDVKFLTKLLELGEKIEHIGNIDKINYIEIDNDYLYVETKNYCEFTPFEANDLEPIDNDCFSYHWNIKIKEKKND